MGFVFGIDEAGYGPRLGPLVVAASGWKVNGDPSATDLWTSLDRVVSRQREGSPEARLHVADSKEVYSSTRGLANLERSVLSLLAAAGHRPNSVADLWSRLGARSSLNQDGYLANEDLAIPLPLAAQASDIDASARRLAEEFERQEVRLHSVEFDIVEVERFNRLTGAHGSKGATLTQVSLDLLARCWRPHSGQPLLVLADRHGGRRFYRGALVEALEGRLVTCIREQPECSQYRVGQSEIRFEIQGERHFPVAVASMCAKYLRELMMEAFNRFWKRHVPGLKATKGYPGDAGRFREEIASAQRRLGIRDEVLWRIS